MRYHDALALYVWILRLTLCAASGNTTAHEQAIITAAPAPVLQWPIVTSAISSLFGRRLDPITKRTRFHHGVDLEGTYGAPVAAAADGFVTSIGWHKGHGRRVVITHDGGYTSTYSHLSRIVAMPHTHVNAGEHIGLVGNSGRSTGPHLHFEISKDGVTIDPLTILEALAQK